MRSPFRSADSTHPPPARWSRKALLVFLLCLTLGAVVTTRRALLQRDAARAHTQTQAVAFAASAQRTLGRALEAAAELGRDVRQAGGQFTAFQSTANELLTVYPAVARFTLEPGGIVREVVPRAGHDSLLGRNVFNDTASSATAQAARATRRLVVEGPVRLITGEPVLTGRQPVFLTGRDGREQFWGFVTVTIRLPLVARSAQFEALGPRGYDYIFYAPAREGQPAMSFESNVPHRLRQVIIAPIHAANAELALAIRPRRPALPWTEIVYATAMVLLLSGALAGLVQALERRREAAAAVADANARAARQNERFRALLEAAPEALILADRAGLIQLANAQAERLFGWTRKELIGQPIELLLPERARKAHPTHRARYLGAPATRVMGAGLEITAVRKDGSEFPVEVNVSPIESPDGDGAWVCGSVRDVTERRRAQQALADRFAFQQALLNSIPYPMFVKDAAARFLGCNRAYEEAFGTTSAALVGKTVLDLDYLAPEERARFHAEDSAVIAESGRRQYELAIEFADGETHHTLYTVDGFGLADGRLGGLIGLLVDLTPLKRAEERTRLILDSATEGIFGLDRDGHVTFVNPAACQLLGFAAGELIGQPAHARLMSRRADGRPFPLAESPLYAAYHEGRACRGDDDVLWRKDETPMPVTFGATPILKDREVVGAVVSFLDITARKQADADLAAARERAEEATRHKSMFLANMSHEIRTPMNAIIGLADLALRTELSARQRDYLVKLHRAGMALLGILNDILDFSKIEAGRLELERTEFRLEDVLATVVSVTSGKAAEKGIELLIEVAPEVPAAWFGDPVRLGQILTNLVGNAVKFTPRGGVRVSVALVERIGREARLRFTVRDTGVGLTREAAAKLFQPFTQSDMSTTRKHGGTGLGLTICKRLVELMQGEITVESAPGQGSEFSFTVRLELNEAAGAAAPAPAELELLRVLVVDDYAAAREFAVETLRPLCAEVVAAAGAEEALELLRQRAATRPVDVVFMDWRMPGMDGLEAARRIQTDAGLTPKPAIVLTTAYDGPELRDAAEALELPAFLVKPLTRAMLLECLSRLFAPRPAPSDSPAPAASAADDRLRGVRVLLVEDNEINQQIASELLAQAGASVTVAAHGRDACERLERDPTGFDLVLMDLQMPELDGYQATARLRADPRFARLPIIAMTAHATVEERQRCLAAGMNDHLAKPIEPARLCETCARFASGRATGDPAEPSAASEEPAEPQTQHAAPEPQPDTHVAQTETAEEAAAQEAPTQAEVPPGEPLVPATPAAAGETVGETTRPKSPRRKQPKRDAQLGLFGEPGAASEEMVQPAAPVAPATARAAEAAPSPEISAPEASPVTPEPAALPEPDERTIESAAAAEAGPVAPPPRPARRAAPADAALGLPAIAGLDASDGLQRVAGNAKLYLKLLTQFVEQQAHAAEEIRDRLVEGDAAAAEHAAHSLKGVAGNLGATEVHAAAAEVERAIRARAEPADVERLWGELDDALGALLRELKPALRTVAKPPAPAEKPPPPLDLAQFRKAARELWPLLADSDPGAADCLAAQRDTLRAAFPPEAFREFERLLGVFEFAPARELLKKTARKHGVTL